MTISELRALAIQSAQTYYQFLSDKGKGISSVNIREIHRINSDTFHLLLASRLPAGAATSLDSLQFRLYECEYNSYQIMPIEYIPSRAILVVKAKSNWIPVLSEAIIPDKNAAVFSDLKFLVKRVEEWYIKYGNLIVPPELLPVAAPPHVITSADVSHEQFVAISGALSSPATYIWGAPGTGKTRVVLASCILSLLHDKKKVLIAAPTNNALEQVLYGLLPVLSEHDIPLDQVLRLGTPTSQFADRYPQVCESAGISRQIQQLENELKQIQDCLGYRSDMIQWQDFVKRSTQLCSQFISISESFERECTACEALNLSGVHLRADDTLLRREAVQLLHKLQSAQKKRDALSRLKFLWKKQYSAACAEESRLVSLLQINKEKLGGLTIQIRELDSESAKHKEEQRKYKEISETIRTQLIQLSSSRPELLQCAKRFSISHAPECVRDFQTILESIEAASKEALQAFSAYDMLGDNVLSKHAADISDKLDGIQDFSTAARIENASVLALTLDKFISLDVPFDSFAPYHVFIDESAYCPLIKSVPLLSLGVPVTLLGDHMQLPPVCEMNTKDFQSVHCECCCLWAQSSIYLDSAFALSFDLIWKEYLSSAPPRFTCFNKYDLTGTYRFGASLADILSEHIYTPDFHSVILSGTELIFLDAPRREENKRRISSAEADAIENYLAFAKLQDYAILTPYRHQRALLSKQLPFAAKEDRILTVHASQGREYDTVIFSVVDCTTSDMFYCNTRKPIGKRVVNTAVSRAKKRLVIVCDQAFWLSQSHQLVSDLIRSARLQHTVDSKISRYLP